MDNALIKEIGNAIFAYLESKGFDLHPHKDGDKISIGADCYEAGVFSLSEMAIMLIKSADNYQNKHSEAKKPAEIATCTLCGGEIRVYRKDSGEWADHECPTQHTTTGYPPEFAEALKYHQAMKDHVTDDVRKYGREVGIPAAIPEVYSTQNSCNGAIESPALRAVAGIQGGGWIDQYGKHHFPTKTLE